MARKKIITRRSRTPEGMCRVEVWLPRETGNRIVEHCKRNGIKGDDFLKKAIYDALPVHYEVTEDWVFPFGKYAGETASTVKQLDPGYIDWCYKNISGFMYQLPADESAKTTDIYNRYSSYWRAQLQDGEHIHFNKLNNRVWAYKLTEWGQRVGWRKLGEYTT